MSDDSMQGRPWWWSQCLFGWLNLVLAAPMIYIYIGLPLLLRQQGWSGTGIGLLQLCGLPALLKFLLAVPVQRWRLGTASYRNWVLLLGLAYIASLWGLAYSQRMGHGHLPLLLLAMLCSLFGSWIDTPLNALAIRLLPEAEQFKAGSLRAAATSLAAIVGGGFMLVLQSHLGWAWPFRILALGVVSGLAWLWWAAGREDGVAPGLVSTVGRQEWRQAAAWFAQPGHRYWALMLVAYYPLIGAIWVFLKPLLLDHGFRAEQVAWLVGVGGGGLAAIASLTAIRLSGHGRARRALPWLAGGNLLALGSLAVATRWPGGHGALACAALAVALMMGASGGLIFGLMMQHTRPGLEALDYGLQSSLFVFGRTLLPLLAGLLLDHAGDSGLFAGLMLGVVAVGLLSWRRGHTLMPPPSMAPQGRH